MTKNLANQLLAFGIAVQPASDTRPASKPPIDWNKRLPRTFAEVLHMPMTHPDRAGFIESTAATTRRNRCHVNAKKGLSTRMT